MASQSNNEDGEYTVDEVLTNAYKRELTDVIVIGTTADGRLRLTTTLNRYPDILWDLRVAERQLLDLATEEDEDDE